MSKFVKILAAIGLGLSAFGTVNGQNTDPKVSDSLKFANKNWLPSRVPDGVIDRVEHDYKVQPWKPIREIDIAYYHRVWKVIPVKEKQNAPFLYKGDEFSNGGSFVEILNHEIRQGRITAYNPVDDRFTTPLTMENFDKQLNIGLDSIWVYNDETEEEELRVIEKDFNIDYVTRYMVKEDWMFDRNSGRVQKRIIGIAPVLDFYENGQYSYSQIMYWIYYPQARQILGKYEVYNPKNMVKRMTWIDYLEGGYYSSFVSKYSKNNPHNRMIKQAIDLENPNNIDLRALMEGERVVEDLLNQELDMWER